RPLPRQASWCVGRRRSRRRRSLLLAESFVPHLVAGSRSGYPDRCRSPRFVTVQPAATSDRGSAPDATSSRARRGSGGDRAPWNGQRPWITSDSCMPPLLAVGSTFHVVAGARRLRVT